jgi:hypothetical protein
MKPVFLPSLGPCLARLAAVNTPSNPRVTRRFQFFTNNLNLARYFFAFYACQVAVFPLFFDAKKIGLQSLQNSLYSADQGSETLQVVEKAANLV